MCSIKCHSSWFNNFLNWTVCTGDTDKQQVTCIRFQSSACSCPGVCSVSISPKTLQFCWTTFNSLRSFANCSTSSRIGPPPPTSGNGTCPSYKSTMWSYYYLLLYKEQAQFVSVPLLCTTQPTLMQHNNQTLGGKVLKRWMPHPRYQDQSWLSIMHLLHYVQCV